MISRFQSKAFQGVLAIALAVFATTACNDLLEVSDPARYTDEDLDNALAAVANGVEGRLHASMLQAVIHTALLGDEFMHTGTWTQYEDSDQGRVRAGDSDQWNGGPLMSVRLEAQKAEERFLRVMGDSANRTKFMAQAKLTEGAVHLLLGMITCEGTIEPGGQAVPDSALYQAAIPVLTRALEIAQAANEPLYANAARAFRARAHLLSSDYDAALADAQGIPEGFVYTAKYSEQGTSNSLVTLNHYTENKAAGLDARRWAQVDTMAGFLIDKWSGELDTRVKIVHRVGNRLGVDGRTKFYSHDKYRTRADGIPLTHSAEMRLIEAEAYWRKNDFTNAIAKMNAVRSTVGLPPLDNPGTSQGVLERLLEERFATLFLEGQRANDLYRFNLFPQVIGTGFNTKFPLNNNEVLNNDNISRPRSCPAVS